MEKYFKVGQTVWSKTYGKGVVESDNHSLTYPICVKFIGTFGIFTNKGEINRTLVPDLFQNEPEYKPNIPIIEFEKGELVWVSDNEKVWNARFYSYLNVDGKHFCFTNQIKEGASKYWKYIRKFNDNPLL